METFRAETGNSKLVLFLGYYKFCMAVLCFAHNQPGGELKKGLLPFRAGLFQLSLRITLLPQNPHR